MTVPIENITLSSPAEVYLSFTYSTFITLLVNVILQTWHDRLPFWSIQAPLVLPTPFKALDKASSIMGTIPLLLPTTNSTFKSASIAITLPAITPLSSYEVVGWATSTTATTGLAPGSKLTLTKDVTYYAITKPKSSSGGSSGGSSGVCISNVSKQLKFECDCYIGDGIPMLIWYDDTYCYCCRKYVLPFKVNDAKV